MRAKTCHDENPAGNSACLSGQNIRGANRSHPIPDIPELEAERKTLAQQVQFVEELTDESD